MVKYADIAQNIIDAHPTSVRQLLISKGIHKDPSPAVLLDTYHIFGKPFISELTNIIHQPVASFANYVTLDGNTLSAADLTTMATDGVAKKSVWETLAGVFDEVSKVATTVAKTTNTAKNIVQPASGAPSVFEQDQQKALQEAEQKKQTRNMIIAAVGVILLLIIVLIITKK